MQAREFLRENYHDAQEGGAWLRAAVMRVTLTALLFFPLLCGACASVFPARFVSPLYQYTVYSGEPQAIDARFSRKVPFAVSYFSSAEAPALDSGGSAAVPRDAGLYYARIRRPGAADTVVEYRIARARVTIVAEDTQEAQYDGNPKRVTAATTEPVPLSVSYFPSRQSRAAAAVLETRPEQRTTRLRGLTRIESPPKEPGVYFVSVYYQGDTNYLPAEKEIEFTIRGRETKNAK